MKRKEGPPQWGTAPSAKPADDYSAAIGMDGSVARPASVESTG